MSPHFAHSTIVLEQRRRAQRAAAIIAFGALTLLSAALIFFLMFGRLKPVAQTSVVEAPSAAAIPMTQVFVATRDIDAGERLSANVFRAQTVMRAALFGTNVVTDLKALEGQYARSMILAGQPLYSPFVTAKRGTSEIERLIPKGFRAVTIPVDARTSVEGWVRPNSQVGVNWIYQVNGAPAAIVLIQNAKVLSVERSLQGEDEARVPSTVTLLVHQTDAPRLQLAMNQGSIFLTLRGAEDGAEGDEGGTVTIANLLGVKPAAPLRNKDTIVLTQPDGSKARFILEDGILKPLDDL